METFKKITPSKENFELALTDGFTHLMTFESSKDVIVLKPIIGSGEVEEEVINEYDYSDYDFNDHRYTMQPINIDELEQFNYFQ